MVGGRSQASHFRRPACTSPKLLAPSPAHTLHQPWASVPSGAHVAAHALCSLPDTHSHLPVVMPSRRHMALGRSRPPRTDDCRVPLTSHVPTQGPPRGHGSSALSVVTLMPSGAGLRASLPFLLAPWPWLGRGTPPPEAARGLATAWKSRTSPPPPQQLGQSAFQKAAHTVPAAGFGESSLGLVPEPQVGIPALPLTRCAT